MFSRKNYQKILLVILAVAISIISFLSIKTIASADELSIDTGVFLSQPHNTRDLGGVITTSGRHVKNNELVRSDSLNQTTANDAMVLRENHHVTNIIDFRSNAEVTVAPDKNLAWFFYQHQAISPQLYYLDGTHSIKSIVKKVRQGHQTGDQIMLDMYDYIADSQQSVTAYKTLFKTLLTNDNATLYHCTSGKDRTGVATALILTALGSDKQTIGLNYLESNSYRQIKVNNDLQRARKYTKSQRILDVIQDMESVKQPYLDEYFNELTSRYGGVTQYLHNQLGLTDQDIQQLQSKYLAA